MPSLAMYRISPPSDSAEFEKICMDFLAHRYNADANLYGRNGQSQQGLDILVTLEDNSYIGAQCKAYKATSVTIKKLDEWISKVDNECKLPIKELIIIVSVDIDSVLQGHICKKTTERIHNGNIPVKIIFWEDILHFIKKDQTMLRMYYPEFYQGEEVKLKEAVISPEEKFPERIKGVGQLRNLFFDEAVKYRVEEFLKCNPINGVPFELVGYADAFVFSINKLLYRAPMLSAEDCFFDIQEFLKSFDEYCGFLPNVTEAKGNTVYATNKYCTSEEKADLVYNEELRRCAIDRYEELKNI